MSNSSKRKRLSSSLSPNRDSLNILNSSPRKISKHNNNNNNSNNGEIINTSIINHDFSPVKSRIKHSSLLSLSSRKSSRIVRHQSKSEDDDDDNDSNDDANGTMKGSDILEVNISPIKFASNTINDNMGQINNGDKINGDKINGGKINGRNNKILVTSSSASSSSLLSAKVTTTAVPLKSSEMRSPIRRGTPINKKQFVFDDDEFESSEDDDDDEMRKNSLNTNSGEPPNLKFSTERNITETPRNLYNIPSLMTSTVLSKSRSSPLVDRNPSNGVGMKSYDGTNGGEVTKISSSNKTTPRIEDVDEIGSDERKTKVRVFLDAKIKRDLESKRKLVRQREQEKLLLLREAARKLYNERVENDHDDYDKTNDLSISISKLSGGGGMDPKAAKVNHAANKQDDSIVSSTNINEKLHRTEVTKSYQPLIQWDVNKWNKLIDFCLFHNQRMNNEDDDDYSFLDDDKIMKQFGVDLHELKIRIKLLNDYNRQRKQELKQKKS